MYKKVIPYIGTKIICLPLFSHNSTQKAPPDEISIMHYTKFCVITNPLSKRDLERSLKKRLSQKIPRQAPAGAEVPKKNEMKIN